MGQRVDKGARGFTASQTGLLAARSGVAPDSELAWLDRAGNRIGAPLAKGLAADGRFLVNQVDPAELATPLTIALNWDAALHR